MIERTHGLPLYDGLDLRLRTDLETGCWVWIGRIVHGYGYFRGLPVHRISFERHRGPIPAGLEIDHLCRNRACANPAHLDAVTHRENVLRGRAPTAKTFDPKCWELACHFLADVPHATDDDRRQLARDLQQTAEDAIVDLETGGGAP